MSNVVFRVDASIWIGSGHVMRCLVLADELKRIGYSTEFACIPQPGDMINLVRQRGHKVSRLTPPASLVIPTHETDYLAWLQRSVEEDASDFVSLVKSADLVVTDHYAIAYDWHVLIKNSFHCKIFAIDDLVRKHKADLILDQTLGRKSTEYQSDGKVISGSQFALLAPAFSVARKQALRKKINTDALRVLVTMGGIDRPNATLKVLQALVPSVKHSFTVLLNKGAPHYNEVANFCAQFTNVKHENFVHDMVSLMLDHDIAIGAPGVSSYERACLGMPAIIITLADNQADNCRSFVDAQAALAIELGQVPGVLVQKLEELVQGYAGFSRKSYDICDGRGLERVKICVESLLAQETISVFLDLAKLKDMEVTYEWQMHPNTRRFFRNKSIPTWEEHSCWFLRKIEDKSSYFYMVRSDFLENSLGVVRLEPDPRGGFEVSILTSPLYYGRGVASKALNKLNDAHPLSTLYAEVSEDNVASQKLFLNSGYTQASITCFIRRPLNQENKK